MSLSEKWNLEYKTSHAIPSSLREEPSHGLLKAIDAGYINSDGSNLLDLGCGNGRNSFYLASQGFDVTSVDFSNEALELVRQRLKSDKYLKLQSYDLSTDIPFDDETFDYVLDSYFHCHFVNIDIWTHILQEIHRTLKTGGTLISIQLSTSDEYYISQKDRDIEEGFTSRDTGNGFEKLHLEDKKYKEYLEQYGFATKNISFEFDDIVLGQNYTRSISVFSATKL
jgi:SAM-dependent methyltransferase